MPRPGVYENMRLLFYSAAVITALISLHSFSAEAASSSNISLTAAILGESHYDICRPLTIVLKNNGEHSEQVGIAIRLEDSSGVLADRFTAHVNIPAGQTSSVYNGCSAQLGTDSYSYSLDIFKARGHKILKSDLNIATFTIVPIK